LNFSLFSFFNLSFFFFQKFFFYYLFISLLSPSSLFVSLLKTQNKIIFFSGNFEGKKRNERKKN